MEKIYNTLIGILLCVFLIYMIKVLVVNTLTVQQIQQKLEVQDDYRYAFFSRENTA